jgi:hypothetical protein
MRVLAVPALVLSALLSTLSAAEAQSVSFGGERYSPRHQQTVNASHSYVELGRDGESLKGWTRLVTLHAFPQARDVAAAAGALARTVRQRDASTKMRLIANDATGEAMLDFLAFKGEVASSTCSNTRLPPTAEGWWPSSSPAASGWANSMPRM